MRGIEGGVDVLFAGAGNVAKLAAGDRRDVVEIFAFDRLAPFAADEVAVFQLERRLDDFLMQHVILP
jgi:hypothetical protein